MTKNDHVCSCCGRPLGGGGPIAIDPVTGIASFASYPSSIRLTGTQTKLLEVLLRDTPRAVSYDCIIDAVYSDHVDGGPEDVMGNIKVHVCNLRRMIREAGWPVRITTYYGRSYALAVTEMAATPQRQMVSA